MRRAFVVLVGVAALALVGVGAEEDLCGLAQRLMPEECVTQEDFFVALNLVLGGCVGGLRTTPQQVVAALQAGDFLPKGFVFSPTSCVAKGLASQIVYRTFGLRPRLEEWLWILVAGLQPDMATAIAQRECVMVLGRSDETISGREMVALILAWAKFVLSEPPSLPWVVPEWYKPRLWSVIAHITIEVKLMTWEEAAIYIPGLIAIPTS